MNLINLFYLCTYIKTYMFIGAPIFLETIIVDRILLYIIFKEGFSKKKILKSKFCKSYIKVQKFRDYRISAKFFLTHSFMNRFDNTLLTILHLDLLSYGQLFILN